MWKSGRAMAFNRKSILNMQLPTESGWGLTVSIYEKNVIHGKAVMLFGHRMNMRGILYSTGSERRRNVALSVE